jgi:hypothetical protein
MAKGDTMLNVFFADKLKGSQTFFVVAEEHMQRILPEEARKLDAQVNLPKVWEKAQVNKHVIKDLPSRETYREIGKMKIGTGAYFSAAGAGVPRTPLRDVLLSIQGMLKSMSPVRAKGYRKRTPPGTYRGSHEIWTLGRPGLPSVEGQTDTDWGQVLSRLDYSSTLETPDWSKRKYRTYSRVIERIGKQSMWAGEYDIVMTFADPTFFGGQIYTSTYSKANPLYAIPVITVMPLNSLPARMKSALAYKRRRSLRERGNVKALAKRKETQILMRRLRSR